MGAQLTKLSPNAAIDYEEDKQKIELTSFRIQEAESEGLIPIDPDRDREVQYNDSGHSGLSGSQGTDDENAFRPRLFSTFMSATRPSTRSEDSEYRLKFQDILSSGVNMAPTVGDSPEALYVRRKAQYDFVPKVDLKNLKLILAQDLNECQYASIKLNEPMPPEIRLLPLLTIFKLGDLRASTVARTYEQDIFLPEKNSGYRQLCLFMVDGDDDHVLVKARAVFMKAEDQAKIEYMSAHMEERDGKLAQLVSNAVEGSAWKIYHSAELLEYLRRRKSTALPPVRFELAYDDILLAYRCFEPPNKDAILANLVIMVMDSTFLEYAARLLSTTHPIRVYLVDTRGFGFSGGERGACAKVSDLYKDIKKIIRMVRGSTDQPVILGGHCFTAPLVFNYCSWSERDSVDGVVMISPMFLGPWQGMWLQSRLKTLIKEGVISNHPNKMRIATITKGKFFGKTYVLNLRGTDDIYDINPMYVGRITANYLRAAMIERSSKAFKSVELPVLTMLAEKDELMHTDQVRGVIEPGLAHPDSRVEYILGSSSLGMVMNDYDTLGKWIMELSVVQPFISRAQGPRRPFVTEEDILKIQPFLEPKLYQSIKEVYDARILDKPTLQDSCGFLGPINFDLFEPAELPARPIACMVLLAPKCFCSFLPSIAQKYRIAIFRMDNFCLVNGSLALDCRHGFIVIRTIIKLVKANYAAAPVFLGGVSFGAAAVINYASVKEKESVNGYVLISPIADPDTPVNKPFVTTEATRLVWDPSAVVFCSRGVGKPNEEEKDILARCRIFNHEVTPMRPQLPSDMVSAIKNLDGPAAVFLPSESDFMNNKRLHAVLSKFMNTPFQTAELCAGDVHDVLKTVSSSLGSWMMQLATSVSPRSMLRLPRAKLDDFEPVEMIGKGTFGKVWLVRHKKSNRFLAMKVLEKKSIVDNKQETQVIREKIVLAEASNCPFIVSYVGAFQNRRNLFLLMEFVIGGELFTRLSQVGKFTVDAAKFYVAEVLVALQYLHEHNIVYRDLKPENIVLDALGHVRLVDFGFARQLDARGRAGSFCGSPFYIAPEMLASSQYGTSVDVWAVGVLIYELLVGAPPFTGKSANEVYRKILFSNLEIPYNIDADARDLITRILDPCPDSRLGCNRGIEEIMKHKWFKGITWDRVKGKQLPPPHQPLFTYEGDTANFVKFSSSVSDFDDSSVDSKYDGLFPEY